MEMNFIYVALVYHKNTLKLSTEVLNVAFVCTKSKPKFAVNVIFFCFNTTCM